MSSTGAARNFEHFNEYRPHRQSLKRTQPQVQPRRIADIDQQNQIKPKDFKANTAEQRRLSRRERFDFLQIRLTQLDASPALSLSSCRAQPECAAAPSSIYAA